MLSINNYEVYTGLCGLKGVIGFCRDHLMDGAGRYDQKRLKSIFFLRLGNEEIHH